MNQLIYHLTSLDLRVFHDLADCIDRSCRDPDLRHSLHDLGSGPFRDDGIHDSFEFVVVGKPILHVLEARIGCHFWKTENLTEIEPLFLVGDGHIDEAVFRLKTLVWNYRWMTRPHSFRRTPRSEINQGI